VFGNVAVGRGPVAAYDAILSEALEDAGTDGDVVGLLLTGSWARGDGVPGSDLDLRYVLVAGARRPFRSDLDRGVRVEREYDDAASARATMEARPMHVYAYLDGRILYDPEGVLEELQKCARRRFETYRCSEADRARICWWLGSALEKVRSAMSVGDSLKAAFVVGTSSWQMMEGLWAANDRPVPPSSSVHPHLQDLSRGPHDAAGKFRTLFVGDTAARIAVWIELAEWTLAQLDASDPSMTG
jgi:predicted nucleotidyltransferase